MKIDQHNYETILLDYLDGNLNASEVADVLLFLEQNPHIREEFDGLADISLADDTMYFDATPLRKPSFQEVSGTYETLLIGKLEGDLDATDQQLLQQGFTLYPELQKEDQLFAQTRLTADPAEVFTGKSVLKKGRILTLTRQSIIRIAAMLLLIGGLGLSIAVFTPLENRMQAVYSPAHRVPVPGDKPVHSVSPSISQPQPVRELAGADPISISKPQPQHPVAEVHTLQYNHEIEPKAVNPLHTHATQLALLDLPASSAWIDHGQPVQSETNEEYISLPAFLNRQFTKEKKQLEQRTLTAIRDIHKTTGFNIIKDAAGRITHFEIAALGIEWSQTK